MAEIICGIYKITSPTGRIYIGQSVDILRRFEQYYRLNCEGQTKLYNSFKKHTPDFHTFEIVEKCEESILTDREAFYIQFYNSHSSEGLNCRIPKYKNNSGYLCKETKAKMSLAQMGNTKWLGKRHTEEASYSHIYNYNLLKQMLNTNSPVKNKTSLIYA